MNKAEEIKKILASFLLDGNRVHTKKSEKQLITSYASKFNELLSQPSNKSTAEIIKDINLLGGHMHAAFALFYSGDMTELQEFTLLATKQLKVVLKNISHMNNPKVIPKLTKLKSKNWIQTQSENSRKRIEAWPIWKKNSINHNNNSSSSQHSSEDNIFDVEDMLDFARHHFLEGIEPTQDILNKWIKENM